MAARYFAEVKGDRLRPAFYSGLDGQAPWDTRAIYLANKHRF